MISRFLWGAAAATLVTVAGSSVTHAQQPVMAKQMMSQPIASLEAWDKQVGLLTQLAWGANTMSQATGPDRAGHTLESYWNDNVLTEGVKRRLDELHGKAEAQSASGDSEGLKSTLAEAEPIIKGEAYKAFVVMGYWGMQDTVAYQLKTLQPWLDRAPAEEQKTASDRVNGIFDRMQKGYVASLQATDHDLSRGLPPEFLMAASSAIQFVSEERLSLVKQQENLPLPYEVAPLKATEPCAVSNAPQPGSDEPGIAPDFPPSEPFYPAEMKRRIVMGNVVVSVDVSATGCAESARLAGTSGVKELDDAALRFALAGRYFPAADGDKAVPGTLEFRVKFDLLDPAGKP